MEEKKKRNKTKEKNKETRVFVTLFHFFLLVSCPFCSLLLASLVGFLGWGFIYWIYWFVSRFILFHCKRTIKKPTSPVNNREETRQRSHQTRHGCDCIERGLRRLHRLDNWRKWSTNDRDRRMQTRHHISVYLSATHLYHAPRMRNDWPSGQMLSPNKPSSSPDTWNLIP